MRSRHPRLLRRLYRVVGSYGLVAGDGVAEPTKPVVRHGLEHRPVQMQPYRQRHLQ